MAEGVGERWRWWRRLCHISEMDREIDLTSTGRDMLIAIIVSQQAIIAGLEKRIAQLEGLRIGAAPGPDTALRRLLAEAGVDPAADDVALAPVPGSGDAGVSLARIHRTRVIRQRNGDLGRADAIVWSASEPDGRSGAGRSRHLECRRQSAIGRWGRDGGMRRSRGHSRTGLARVGGDDGLPGEWIRRRRCRQAGNGRARSRARARLNWVSQGQRFGRCKVRRRAEWVSRPAIEKKRRRRVLVVTTGSPSPMRAVQRDRLCAITWTASQAPLAAKRPEGR